ncbi:PREDICTED: uncharacterized protein K02A2.6-like [Paramuricea clavata]|uniref:PREDICTED: uncharacterized protein K02A2.6-like n=1 Tax=Paramuricea clavata TaxID=317549 RepID=A0A6S7LRP5_PARCT|nr:PREDICTED: uncharacterized protein K02A2.6-like [Paramuricea clavata]
MDESEEGSNSAAVTSSTTTPTPMSAVNNIPRSGLPPFDPHSDRASLAFDPVRNQDMAIYELRQIKQETNETMNNLYRSLKEKTDICEFTDVDSEIRTQIIHTMSDSRLRRKGLREQLDLKALLAYDRPRHRKPQRLFQARQNNDADQARKQGEHNQSSRECRNYGGPFPHKEGKLSCPARGKKCHACGKLGHFAKHCLSKAQQSHQGHRQSSRKEVNEVTQTRQDYLDDTDEEFAYVINSSTKPPETRITVENVASNVIVDTGSSVNLLNKSVLKEIQKKNPNIMVQSSHKKVFPYGTNTPLELIGESEAQITASSDTTTGTFLVTNTNSTCLISYQTSTDHGLLNLKVCSVSVDHPDPDVSAVLNKHKKVFEGMGNLKDKGVKLEIDPDVQPVAQKARRIPYSMKDQVNRKLREMEEHGIIEKAEGATPWLSSLIAIPKKAGDVRLVLDMRIPNQALVRRRVQMPTVDDILHKMEESEIFTEVDLLQGYLHSADHLGRRISPYHRFPDAR